MACDESWYVYGSNGHIDRGGRRKILEFYEQCIKHPLFPTKMSWNSRAIEVFAAAASGGSIFTY